MDRGTPWVVLDGSGPSGRSWTGTGTLGEVLDGLLEPQRGLGRVEDPREITGRFEGPLGRSGTVRWSLG